LDQGRSQKFFEGGIFKFFVWKNLDQKFFWIFFSQKKNFLSRGGFGGQDLATRLVWINFFRSGNSLATPLLTNNWIVIIFHVALVLITCRINIQTFLWPLKEFIIYYSLCFLYPYSHSVNTIKATCLHVNFYGFNCLL